VVGSWNLVIETPIGTQESVLVVAGTTELLEGKLVSEQGEAAVRDVVFDGEKLVFVDGMHQFEFALRDFSNSEAWSSPGGTIVLHDCVPIVPASAERKRRTRFWVGDTWKAALAIARHRPDLRIRTILTPPSGLVVIRKLDPSSTLLRDRFDAIVSELRGLSYPFLPGDWPPELGCVPNDAVGLREALG
jgi:hypothetical protein